MILSTTERERISFREFSNAYLETLAVYRQIAERLPMFDTLLFHGSAIAVIIQLVGQLQAPLSGISSFVPRFFACIASAVRLMEIESYKEANTEEVKTGSEAKEDYYGERKEGKNMDLLKEIEAYHPVNEQEEYDKKQILFFLKEQKNCLLRENLTAHVTVSVWTVNKERTKTLMVYHNIYDSWAWIGGHADGDADLRNVALKELREETGVKNAKLVSDGIFSLEILTVDGHEKRGKYVPSHLHLNITYLAEADERETLHIREEENTGVRWWDMEEALQVSSEKWMVERVYKKLLDKITGKG